MGRWLAAVALFLMVAAPVYSQAPGRLLPANGKVGDLGSRQAYPLVQIGSEMMRLAAGALIYDESNRTIVHGALPEQGTILYVQEPGGSVSRIYLLRPDELERIRRAAQR